MSTVQKIYHSIGYRTELQIPDDILYIIFKPSNSNHDKVIKISLNDLFYAKRKSVGSYQSLDLKERFIESVGLSKTDTKFDIVFGFQWDYDIELNDSKTEMIITIRLEGMNTVIRKICISIPGLEFLRLE